MQFSNKFVKGLLMVLLFCSLGETGLCQTSYHHYYDSTSEWRYISGNCWGFNCTIRYFTTYYDGDTLIGSNWYYRMYTRELDSASVFMGSTTVSTFLTGPSFRREDSTHKVWFFDTRNGVDVLDYDWGNMLNVGDTFLYSTCTVGFVDSIYLGSMPLKRVRPVINIDSNRWTRGYVEGVGYTAQACGTGIESGGFTVCYSRQGHTIFLSQSIPCGSFLPPVRTHHYGDSGIIQPTSVASLRQSSALHIYPNPTTSIVRISLPLAGDFQVLVVDQYGRRIFQQSTSLAILQINAANFPPGRYNVSATNGESLWCGQFIKE